MAKFITGSARRILIATMGSLGDLHPCLALGVELKRRGHAVTIASTEFYRKKVEDLGMGFHPMRPVWDPTDAAIIGQCENLRTGPEILFRRLVLPHLRDTYDDLLAAAKDADLMLAGEVVFPAPLVAEKLGMRWASLILCPCSFFSSHDPSVIVTLPSLIHLHKAGAPTYRAALNLLAAAVRHWWRPIRQLRIEEGLRPDCEPMKDKFSPDLVLALFSRWLAQSQPDWPTRTVLPGFLFYDGASAGMPLDPELERFLQSGDPPIVFTLGSTAVHNPGNFFTTSIEAARRLDARALLIGDSPATQSITPNILSAPYAPYSQVFSRASVVVHQGGVGTTAQALRAGKPTLFVPWGWDQPDNAARVVRRGAALSLAKDRYTVPRAAAALQRLQTDPSFAQNARSAAEHINKETTLNDAVDEIENLFV